MFIVYIRRIRLSFIFADRLSFIIADRLSFIFTDRLSFIFTDRLSFIFTDRLSFIITDRLSFIQLFRERLSEKKTTKCTRQDRKVVWVFSGILHIGLEEIYKFVFLHVENLFFLSGGLYL